MEKELIDFINANEDAINNEEWENLYGQFERSVPLAPRHLTEVLYSIGCNPEYKLRTLPSVYLPTTYSGQFDVPDNVYRIDSACFRGCKELTHVNISDSVHEIGENIFTGCNKLVHVRLPETLEILPTGIFSRCESLKNVKLPNSLKHIMPEAFYLSSIEEIAIPDSIDTIPANCFHGCRNLKKIYLPKSITNIRMEAFPELDNFEIIYDGTFSEWAKINRNYNWAPDSTNYTIKCHGGTLKKGI